MSKKLAQRHIALGIERIFSKELQDKTFTTGKETESVRHVITCLKQTKCGLDLFQG